MSKRTTNISIYKLHEYFRHSAFYCISVSRNSLNKFRIQIKTVFVFCSVTVSASFVHRDHSLWQKNPFRNSIWAFTCFCILLFHSLICTAEIMLNDEIRDQLEDAWPAIVFLFVGCFISLIVSEFCKWQEIK